jgi:fumarate reductase flavoprotein subunit
MAVTRTTDMARIAPAPDRFDVHVETLIIGAGACGLVAALSASEAGQQVLVLERDARPAGSTALSAGLIPAAGTGLQQRAGIADDPQIFARDIQAKAKDQNDPAMVAVMAERSASVIDWLSDTHGLPFSVVTDFDYPGHSARRMHGLPSRSGQELIDAFSARCDALGIDIVCDAPVSTLFASGQQIKGVAVNRPDGQVEHIGCGRLILACNGFGGNRTMVAEHMPQIEDAIWFGHDGNRGEAIAWGTALGAKTRHLGAYQGHGNVAHPHGILITWAVITEGGIQVNANGARFWDESQGYSEAARAVLAQPGRIAYAIFDARIAQVARQFADFRAAEAQGAIKVAQTLDDLAAAFELPADTLIREVTACHAGQPDRFGRVFRADPLEPPFCGVRVTGALFHTQGGLEVDTQARVLGQSNEPLPNLYAAGGAACGVSGAGDAGYLSGNGLLSAVVLGRIAGIGQN